MLYADYQYYSTIYNGKLTGTDFETYILKASREIDKYINTELNEAKIAKLSVEAQEKLKYSTCALADLLYRKNEADNTKVTSYSIDSVSKSYNLLSKADYNSEKNDIVNSLPHELTRYL